ncbi:MULTISPECIES: hypothetical protein [Vibrio]|uniref:hypothetical protein n=1 Tax=Vibrio TaxID=662 RepID=UPI0003B23329|nr:MULTISPECIES: hypothetical protein [Vibrio]UAB71458.1 hypothetical protein INR79_06080 [Vibrio sp. SCSIO 43132]CCN68295.1 hypothetical protein VIBNISFn118_100026 [Vibrio nigripulchritudo SFn118]
MRTPTYLKLDGKTVARITDYSFETPWASGNAEFSDISILMKLTNITSMQIYDQELESLDLDDDEEDSLWEAKLSELELTSSDLKLVHDGRWSVSTEDREDCPIYSPKFYVQGVMNWRW